MSESGFTFVRAIVAMGFIAVVAGASWVFAAALLPTTQRFVRWVGAFVVGLWLASVGYHALTAVARFNLVVGSVTVGAVGTGALFVWRYVPGVRRKMLSDREFVRRIVRGAGRPGLGWIRVIAAVPLIPAVLRPLLMPIASWDGLTYHGHKAAMAVQTGASPFLSGPGIWAWSGPKWGGHESLMAWAMLPFHGDLLATFPESIQYLGLGFSVFVLARLMGVREPLGSLSAIAVLTIPTLHLFVGSAYVELGAVTALCAGLVLLVDGSSRRDGGALLLAGAAFGVATAMKNNLPVLTGPLLIVTVFAILRLPQSTSVKWKTGLWTVFVFAACPFPWMIRAHIETGSLLAPLPLRVGPWILGSEIPESLWMMQQPGGTVLHRNLEAEWRVFLEVFGLRTHGAEAFGVLTLVQLVLGALGVFRIGTRRPVLLVSTGLVIVATLGTYITKDFAFLRQLWTTSSCRFLLPVAVMLGMFVAVRIVPKTPAFWATVVALAIFALRPWILTSTDSGPELVPLLTLVAVIVFLVALCLWVRRWRGDIAAAIACMFLCAVGMVALDRYREREHAVLMVSSHQIHAKPAYWSEALPFIDTPGQVHRIALTSGPDIRLDNWFVYPLLGRRFSNDVAYVSPMRDGSIPHFGTAEVETTFAREFSMDAWVLRLREKRITEVFSFLPPSRELAEMRRRPADFEKVVGNNRWALYRLRDRSLSQPGRVRRRP